MSIINQLATFYYLFKSINPSVSPSILSIKATNKKANNLNIGYWLLSRAIVVNIILVKAR